MTKQALTFLFFSSMFLLFPTTMCPQGNPIRSQRELEKQLFTALDRGDTARVNQLMQENRYRLYPIVSTLLDTYASKTLADSAAEALTSIARAEQVALLYQGVFGEQGFLRLVKVYQGWSREQMTMRASVDSLRTQGIVAAEQSDFEVARNMFEEALSISQKIGYLEGQNRAFGNLGNVHDELGNNDTALVYYERSFAIAKELDDKTSETKSMSNLASRSVGLRQFHDALRYSKLALSLSREMDDKFEEGTILGNMGVAYSGLGELDSAAVCYEQSLRLAKETGNQLGVGIRLSNLGGLYARKGDLQKGLGYFRQAADTLRKVRNKKELAKVLYNTGLMLERSGKAEEAAQSYERAAVTAKAVPYAEVEAAAIGNLVVLHGRLGNVEKSLAYSQQLLNIRSTMKDSSGICQALNALGIRQGELGNYREAERYYKQAMDIAQKRKDDQGLLSTYINMGSFYQAVSDYAKALDAYFKALKIAQTRGEPAAERVCYNNLGVTYSDLGQEGNALSYHEKALALSEKMKEKQGIANSKLNMGAIYLESEQLSDRERFQKARQCFEEALTINRDLGNKRVEAMDLINIASVHKRQGENTKALEVFGQALALLRTIGDKRNEGVCIYNIANVYKDMKDDSAALSNLQKALAIAVEVGNPGDIWQPQHEIGLLMEKQGKSREADHYYSQAIDNIESIRSRLQLESFKSGFMEDKIAVYESMVDLLVRGGHYKEAFAYSEKAKARALLDILSFRGAGITKGISKSLRKRKQSLERTLSKIQDDLRDERTENSEGQNTRRIASLERKLTRTRNQYQTMLQEILLRHPQYGQLTGIREPLRIRDIQERILAPQTILVEYFVMDQHTVVWVLDKNSIHCEWIAVKRERLEQMIDSLRQPFREVKEGKITNLALVPFDLTLSQRLYEHLLQPIEKYLSANARLVIIPDGILHYLPFEALVTSIEAGDHDTRVLFSKYERAHYLVEQYAISYAPSASVLDPQILNKEKLPVEGQLLAFGNPDFGKFSRREIGAARDTTPESLRLNIASGGRVPDGLSPLPKSEEEVDGIASIMRPSLTYKGTDAKESVFKQKAGGYPYLHLSSHAFADENQPMYSHVVLAQGNDPKEDGFLYAYEVVNLRLNADLVTLSACETGLGKLSRGEGLMGLTRAFLYAGTPSLLVSLWSVDESTSRIMKDFYQNLKNGMPKAEALRQAKVKMIHTQYQGMSFSHPFLWAPFVLVGRGR